LGESVAVDLGRKVQGELDPAIGSDALLQSNDRFSEYPPIDPQAAWQKTLSELQLQLTSSTFHTWLHGTWVDAYEDGAFYIATDNPYGRDWLQHRLRVMVKRTLKNIVGHMVEVNFIVRPRPAVDSPAVETTPLYRPPAKTPAAAEPALLQPPVRTERAAGRRSPVADPQLNPNYTFDTLVVGKHNQLAWAAAQSVIDRPGQKFNPLFVYGGVGLGKTHLLHAVGHALHQRGFATYYCSSEQFTNELITAIRSQSTEQFRNKYRALDVLLIDDIQFIGGKESTQEEVFHTFNHLQTAGKQVVLSSDRRPHALLSLEERLRSRFAGGIEVDVSQPDFETRVAILQSKAMQLHMAVDIDVLKVIAERVDSNIRDMAGALNNLHLQAQLRHSPLDVRLAVDALEQLAPHRRPCSVAKLIEIVASHYQLSADDLIGLRRTKNIADARHIAMYLLREEHALSLPQIGRLLGNRDHTTVGHGIDKIALELANSESRRQEIGTLREKIYTPYIG
jgi:chromosomal replication initiator protein